MARAEVVLTEQEVPIVGTPEHVGMVLRSYDARGHLLSTDEELMDSASPQDSSGRVAIRARLLMPVKAAPAPPPRPNETARAIRSALTFVTVMLASAVGMIALIYWLISSLVAAVDWSRVVGGGLVLALLVGWLLLSMRRGHPCSGLHCSGCTGR